MSISSMGITNPNLQVNFGESHSAKKTLPYQKLPTSQAEAVDNAIKPALPKLEADNTPEKLYAEIFVNGKPIAKVWESGLAQLANSQAGLADKLVDSDSGPETARDRTEQIAKVLGGKIVLSGESNSYSFSESLAKLLSS